MTQYLLISGPPGAGKDTVGCIVQEMLSGHVVLEKFARPLMDSAAAFGFDMEDTQEAKARKHPVLGVSRREFQIALSETFSKNFLGEDVFGRALLSRTREEDRLVVVTDSGFQAEAIALGTHAGWDSVKRVHISRPGHSYEGDSRTDWRSPLLLQRVDLFNSEDIECLHNDVLLALIELDLLDHDD